MAKILNVSLVTLREKCLYMEFFWTVFPVFSPNAGKYGPKKLIYNYIFRSARSLFAEIFSLPRLNVIAWGHDGENHEGA